jgi:hypothetical protein
MPPRARRPAAVTAATATANSPAAPPSPAAEASLDSLPDAVLAHALLALPLDERLRCAVVSRRFAALLRDTSLTWHVLSFEGACARVCACACCMCALA